MEQNGGYGTYHRHFGRKDIGGQADGYPDVQAFMATYREAEAVVEQYNHSLAEWERHVKEKHRPSKMPERESVINRLRQLQEQSRQQPHRKKSFALMSVSFLHFG